MSSINSPYPQPIQRSRFFCTETFDSEEALPGYDLSECLRQLENIQNRLAKLSSAVPSSRTEAGVNQSNFRALKQHFIQIKGEWECETSSLDKKEKLLVQSQKIIETLSETFNLPGKRQREAKPSDSPIKIVSPSKPRETSKLVFSKWVSPRDEEKAAISVEAKRGTLRPSKRKCDNIPFQDFSFEERTAYKRFEWRRDPGIELDRIADGAKKRLSAAKLPLTDENLAKTLEEQNSHTEFFERGELIAFLENTPYRVPSDISTEDLIEQMRLFSQVHDSHYGQSPAKISPSVTEEGKIQLKYDRVPGEELHRYRTIQRLEEKVFKGTREQMIAGLQLAPQYACAFLRQEDTEKNDGDYEIHVKATPTEAFCYFFSVMLNGKIRIYDPQNPLNQSCYQTVDEMIQVLNLTAILSS